MADRVVVFIDYQNVYRSARGLFHDHLLDPHYFGQINPYRLGLSLAADSPYERALSEVRIYRGLPSATHDPKGYGAARKQIATWRANPMVSVYARPIQYPEGWPDSHTPGRRPMEKGVDVQLALDMALMAHRGQFDVGILFSLDTDLRPALEAVRASADADGRPRAEVAAWSVPGKQCRRLALKGASVYCHWLNEFSYFKVRDNTDYTQ